MKVSLFLGAFLGWLLGAMSVSVSSETPSDTGEDRVQVSFFRNLPPQVQAIKLLEYDSEKDLLIAGTGHTNLLGQVQVACAVICTVIGATLGMVIALFLGRRRRHRALAIALAD